MKWLYHIKSEKTKEGFYRIPKTCVNAEFYRFEKMLETDDSRLVKSAVVNWFNDKHGNKDFSVGMNGYDSIILFSSDDWSEEHDYYFNNFTIKDDYLLHHNNAEEYEEIKKEYSDLKKILQRRHKLSKIIKKLQS